jgi:hypothetical protein
MKRSNVQIGTFRADFSSVSFLFAFPLLMYSVTETLPLFILILRLAYNTLSHETAVKKIIFFLTFKCTLSQRCALQAECPAREQLS